MAIDVKKGAQRKLIPAQSYRAAVVGIYDIGHQDGQYGPYHQIVVTYEPHNKRGALKNDEGKIITINQFYDVVLTKKQKASPLKKLIEAITGQVITADNFSITPDFLDKGVRIAIEHVVKKDGSLGDSVGAVSPLGEDDDEPKAESDSVWYEIETDPADMSAIKRARTREIPKGVPEWVGKMIAKSIEFGGQPLVSASVVGDDDADIPF